MDVQVPRVDGLFSLISKIASISVQEASRAVFLKKIFHTLLDFLDFDAGGIYLVDVEKKIATLVYDFGLDETFLKQVACIDITQPPYSIVFLSGEKLLSEHYAKQYTHLKHYAGILALASIPLSCENGIIGALNLASRRRHVFSDEERLLFDVVGKECGAGIYRFLIQEKLRTSIEDLKRERNLLDRLIETSLAGITLVDRTGKLTFANKYAEKILGLTKREITARNYDDPAWVIQDEKGNPFPPEKLPFMIVSHTQQSVTDARHAIQWPDGHRVLLSINAAPLFDSSGRFDGMVSTLEDITKKVEDEERLKSLYDEAMQISKLKSDLITFASHELKTPLVPIIGWAEFMKSLLVKGVSLDKHIGLEEVASISTSASRLTKIIDTFLDFGRMENKNISLDIQKCQIKILIENALKNVQLLAKSANIVIQNEAEDAELYCDGFRIEQVFINILSNAIKYSPPGTQVRITSQVTPNVYQLMIRDQGFGFTPEQLTSVWRPFSKTKSPQKDAFFESTGVGLYLSKGLVEMQGGTIHIISEGPNKGSMVKIILPNGAPPSMPKI